MAGRRQRTAIAGGLVAGALAGTMAGVRQVYRGAVPPHDGRATVPGLDGAVEIVRDSDGIPHVRATTEYDALAGLGYCHAQDRLWQMELIRRIIRGTLAELVGKEAIDTDRYARTLGLGAVADAEAEGLSEEDRVAVDAYCRGVNAYLEGPSFRLPLELRLLLHRRVGQWTAGDALLGMRVFALSLSQNWEGEIVRSRLADKLGAARLEQLEPGYPGDGYTSLPAGAADAVRAALELRARAGGAEGAGSNNWVISADRTTTGAPLLANDPHLRLAAPCTWYAADIAWDGERAAGLTLAGTPGILIGQTAYAAWGFTNVEADTQDLLDITLDGSEEVRTEQIAVRGRRTPIEHEVVTTPHGPVVTPLAAGETRTFALQWTALRPSGNVGAFRSMVRARSADELVTALAGVGGPTLNCVYATLAGEIGYQMCGGPIPIRAGGNGRFPTAEPWVGTVPYEELPAWRDPEDGAIVTANNRIVADDYPHLIATEWLNPYRAQRIAELLAAQRAARPRRPGADPDRHPLAAADPPPRPDHAISRRRTTSSGARSASSRAGTARCAPPRPAPRSRPRCCGTSRSSCTPRRARSSSASSARSASRCCRPCSSSSTAPCPARWTRSSGATTASSGTGGRGAACSRSASPARASSSSGSSARTRRAGRGATCTCSSSTIRWRRCPGSSACSGAGRSRCPGESDTVWSASQPITDPVSGLETSGPGTRFVANLADPDESLTDHLRRAVGPPGQRALRRPAGGLAGRPDAQAELVRRGDRAQPRRHSHARPGLACRRPHWCSRWPRRSSMRRGTC